MLKDELEIIIITYNRKNKLKKTLQTLITEMSCVKHFVKNIQILNILEINIISGYPVIQSEHLS